MQLDLEIFSSKTSPAGSTTRTTLSDVSWEDLSAQMMPSFQASAREASARMSSGGSTRNDASWSPGGLTQVWLPGHGAGRHGGFSTLNTQAWRNDASVCSLSQILERGPIPLRYYLSAEACTGILRRAGKRGKELPALLARALKAVAGLGQTSNAREVRNLSDSGGNTSGPIDVAACLTAKGQRIDFEVETFVAEIARTLLAKGNDSLAEYLDTYVAHTLRAEGFDASEDGTGRGTPIVPVAFPERMSATQYGATADLSPTLGAVNPTAVAFDLRGREGGAQFEGPHDTANLRAAAGGSSRSYVAEQWAVRRLTPTEAERLQGYPDGWTLIETDKRRTVDEDEAAYLAAQGAHVVRGSDGKLRTNAAADGPRYKGLGNAWAVACVRPIAQRIAAQQMEMF
jgi:hypothetical protein